MTIFLIKTYNICRWYPFDTQTCSMILSPDGNNGEFIEIQDDGLEYLGPMDLTQYFIRSTGISMSEEGSISVVVVLGRRLLGTLLTVYIPTLLLVTISYSTNFFKPFFFEAVVAVNLTCMLVNGGFLQYFYIFKLILRFLQLCLFLYLIVYQRRLTSKWWMCGL